MRVELEPEMGYDHGMKLQKSKRPMLRRKTDPGKIGDKFWVTRVLADLQSHYRTMKGAKTVRPLS